VATRLLLLSVLGATGVISFGCGDWETGAVEGFRDGFDVAWCGEGSDRSNPSPETILVVRLRNPKAGVLMQFGNGIVSTRIGDTFRGAKRREILVLDENGILADARLVVDASVRGRFLRICREEGAVRPALKMLLDHTADTRLAPYVEAAPDESRR
jgi:hypothetical protein